MLFQPGFRDIKIMKIEKKHRFAMYIPKRHILQGTYKMYVPNFNFLAQFEGEIGEEQHFLGSNRGEILIFPFLIDLGGRFFDMLYNFYFDLISIGLK